MCVCARSFPAIPSRRYLYRILIWNMTRRRNNVGSRRRRGFIGPLLPRRPKPGQPGFIGPLPRNQPANASRPVAQGRVASNITTQPRGFQGAIKNGINKSKRSSLQSTVCAITDPFCEQAVGARIPDGSAALTIPYRVTTTRSVAAATSGDTIGLLFAPDTRPEFFNFGDDGTPNQLIFGSTFNGTTAANSFYANYVAESRVVSAGLRWIPTFPSTQNAPLITVADVASPAALLGKTITASNLYSFGTNIRAMDSRQEFSCVGRRQSVEALEFATIGDTESSNAFSGVLVIVQNIPDATVSGYFEMIVNWETTLRLGDSTNTVVNSLASRPPPENKAALTAARKAAQTTNTAVSGPAAVISAHLSRLATAALDDVLTSGFALLGL